MAHSTLSSAACAVLRLLADRHHDLTGLRTQAICRLHALLCQLTARRRGAAAFCPRAGQILRGIRPLKPVATERMRNALDLLGDVRRFDSQLVSLNERIAGSGRGDDLRFLSPLPSPRDQPALKPKTSRAVFSE